MVIVQCILIGKTTLSNCEDIELLRPAIHDRVCILSTSLFVSSNLTSYILKKVKKQDFLRL